MFKKNLKVIFILINKFQLIIFKTAILTQFKGV